MEANTEAAEAPQNESAGPVVPRGIRQSGDTEYTQHWGAFKFTPLWDAAASSIGWSCECYPPKHINGGARCRRSRNHHYPDHIATLRELRWWCVQGYDKNTKKAHAVFKRYPKLADLSSIEKLDEFKIGKFRSDGRPVYSNKRRRKRDADE